MPPENVMTCDDARSLSSTMASAASMRSARLLRARPYRKAWNSRFSRAVSCPSSAGSWNTIPMCERTADGSVTTLCPATSAVPLVGRTSVQRMPMVVDLPAPLGPRKPKISPGRTSRSMPRTAWIWP